MLIETLKPRLPTKYQIEKKARDAKRSIPLRWQIEQIERQKRVRKIINARRVAQGKKPYKF